MSTRRKREDSVFRAMAGARRPLSRLPLRPDLGSAPLAPAPARGREAAAPAPPAPPPPPPRAAAAARPLPAHAGSGSAVRGGAEPGAWRVFEGLRGRPNHSVPSALPQFSRWGAGAQYPCRPRIVCAVTALVLRVSRASEEPLSQQGPARPAGLISAPTGEHRAPGRRVAALLVEPRTSFLEKKPSS
ncbi:translation initiation factor IF-2-like [Cebus imitator]|uniref:translation initiation factor IF-2-like n=1 Tax=Cebus imitator TaxID=2715852 RepID=UPI0018978493|nr:translation initiation factor IF-2-like [Cebus imitator]